MPMVKITGRIRNEAMPINARRDNAVDIATKTNHKETSYDGYRHMKNRIREVDPYEIMGTNLKTQVVKKRNGER